MSEESLKILIITAYPERESALGRILTGMVSGGYETESVKSLSEALEKVDKGNYDAALLDLELPDSIGADTYLMLRGRARDLPMMVFTTRELDDEGRKTVSHGAAAHMVWEDMDSDALDRSIKYAVLKNRYSRRKFMAVVKQEMDVADLGRNRHLFILYKVARVLNSTNSLTELCDEILGLVVEATESVRGAILCYSEDRELEIKSRRETRIGNPLDERFTLDVASNAMEKNNAVICTDSCFFPEILPDGESETVLSVLAVPMWYRDEILGAIYIDNPEKSDAFNEEDMDLLMSIAGQVAMRIHQENMQNEMRQNAILRSGLERFHSPDVANLIFEQSRLDEGFNRFLSRREVSILFADISKSTALLERLDAEEAADLLNLYFGEMTAIIFRYKGTVDKFIGDAIMATFGAPISYGNDAELAIFAAIEMMREMETLQKRLDEPKRFDIRIGINTGMVMTGYLGSRSRLEYSVIGDPVNIAARLQESAPPKTIHVGEETYARTNGVFKFRELGLKQLKGKKKQTMVYEVVY